MRRALSTKRASFAPALLVTLACVTVLVFSTAGCQDSVEQMRSQYKVQWQKTMSDFLVLSDKDDKSAEGLVKNGDVAGVVNLMKERIAKLDTVLGKMFELEPTSDLRKLQAVTLYYLESLKDQWTAQNELNEAVLTGKPTTDLTTIADQELKRTQAIGGQLGLEFQKAGIKLKVPKSQENQAPPESAPQPGSSPENPG